MKTCNKKDTPQVYLEWRRGGGLCGGNRLPWGRDVTLAGGVARPGGAVGAGSLRTAPDQKARLRDQGHKALSEVSQLP